MSRRTEYELLASTETIQVTSPTEAIVKSQMSGNVLTSEAGQILEEETDSVPEGEHMALATEDGAGTEYYKTSLEVTFSIEDLPESYIKKRKHSNKVNTDIDYSDM
ncbi:MAG: hypothetical protein ACTSYL_11055 [Candidatus Thorarchaeota archaeon]